MKQIQPQQETTRVEKCKACDREFPIQELRSHVRYCFLSKNVPESDEEQCYELPDPFGGENVTYFYEVEMDRTEQISPNTASVNQPPGIYNSESVISNSSVEQQLDIEVHRSESELPDEGD